MDINTEVIGWAIGGVSALIGTLATWHASKSKSVELADKAVIASQDRLLELAHIETKEWKDRFDRKHEESKSDREKAHSRAQDSQAAYLALTNEVMELRMKTDMTPINNHMKEQTGINLKIVSGLDAISITQSHCIETQLKLVQRLDDLHEIMVKDNKTA